MLSGFYAYHKSFAGSDLHMLYVRGREGAWLDASSPNKLFPYPPELGKAIVDLDTKGKISVWDFSHSLVFSKLTNLLELLRSPRREKRGRGLKTKRGVSKRGLRVTAKGSLEWPDLV